MKNVKAKVNTSFYQEALHSITVILLIHHIWLHGRISKISGDIEVKPGPNQKQDQSLSISHGNLNSVPAHNFKKLELLEDYISSKKVDNLCVSETFLNSDISCDDDNLKLTGFNSIRADTHLTQKKGGYAFIIVISYL